MKEFLKAGLVNQSKNSRGVCSCNNPTNCKTKCSSGILSSDSKITKIYSK